LSDKVGGVLMKKIPYHDMMKNRKLSDFFEEEEEFS